MALGIEWLGDKLHSGLLDTETKGNQVALSALYTF
jgi:hypothetical protein